MSWLAILPIAEEPGVCGFIPGSLVTLAALNPAGLAVVGGVGAGPGAGGGAAPDAVTSDLIRCIALVSSGFLGLSC